MRTPSDNRFQLEPLEPRLLLAADPAALGAVDSVAEILFSAVEEERALAPHGVAATAEIGGSVWFDANEDGIRDPGEPGVADWDLFLDLDEDGELDTRQSTQTLEATDVGQSFTSGFGSILSDLPVSGLSGRIADLDLKISVTHPDLTQVSINLTAPGGTPGLTDLQGFSVAGGNFVNTKFDDEAATPVDQGSAPYTGSFQARPSISLSDLDGLDPNGTWTLQVVTYGPDVTLDGWSLEITTAVPTEPIASTDANGDYAFTGLEAGSYVVGQGLPNGWTSRAPPDGTQTVNLAEGQSVTGIDFGNSAPAAQVDGTVFHDLDANAFFDFGEPYLGGWTVYVDLNGNSLPDLSEPSAVTGEFGSYSITGIPPGTWTLRQVLPEPAAGESSWRYTTPDSGTQSLTFEPGGFLFADNFGNQQLAAIKGIKWEDANGDGIKAPDETPLAGWTIFLDANQNGLRDEGETSTSTNAEGEYAFLDLVPGSYRVAEELTEGWKQTFPANPAHHDASVAAGGVAADLNFGNQKASLFGVVFHDFNRNGTRDVDEPGVDGWTIELDLGANGSIDDTATTNDAGQFSFTEVPPGDHKLGLQAMTGWVQTSPAAGGLHAVTVIEDTDNDPLDFAAFRKPDLIVDSFTAPTAGFGETVTANYDTTLAGSGKLANSDQWSEEIWITDDGLVDGQGFEILMATGTFTAVGIHNQSITLPAFGTEASSSGNGIVTAAMAEAGLQMVILLDPAEAVDEFDEANNTSVQFADWKLPDLIVEDITLKPFLALNPSTGQFRLQGELRYTIRNAGESAIGAETLWNEQVWLGNDPNVGQGVDAQNGQFHLLVADHDAIAGTAGPLAAGASVMRSLVVDLPATDLPRNFNPEHLQWLIFLDVPEDQQGMLLAPPDDANIGAVYEKHEASPDGTNNIRQEPAFQNMMRVTEDAGGTAFNGASQLQGASLDGRWLLLTSSATNIIPDDPGPGLFIYDRDVSDDGFLDEPGDTSFTRIADMATGFLVAGSIGSASISANGRFVAWDEIVVEQGAGLFSPITDVFLHDRDTDNDGIMDEPGATSTTVVSTNNAGSPARNLNPFTGQLNSDGGGSEAPRVADNGAVFFQSYANNLIAGSNPAFEDPTEDARFPWSGDNSNSLNVFVHLNGVTRLIDVRPDGRPAFSDTRLDSITPDGRKVVFTAFDNDLTPGLPQTFFTQRVFLRDLDTGTTSLVSQSTSGTESNGRGGRISADGTRVVFRTSSTNILGGQDTNGETDVFLRNLANGTTARINLTSRMIDENGTVTGGSEALNGGSQAESLSPDARFVAFTSFADNLGPDMDSTFADGFLYDTVAETLTLYTAAPGGEATYRGSFGVGNGDILSGDNRFVFFTTFSDVLEPKDQHTAFDADRDIFIRYHHPAPVGTLRGRVAADPDKSNDVQPTDPPVSGMTVYVDENNDGSRDPGELFALTNAQGLFEIRVVAEANRPYNIRILTPDPLQQTSPANTGSMGELNGFFRVTFDPVTEGYREVLINGTNPAPGQRIDFGVFTKPDLVVGNLTQDAAAFGQTGGLTLSYETLQQQSGGGILSSDQWTEEVWLTDDGAVDGNGFELLLDSRTRTATGLRELTLDSPAIGDSGGQVPTAAVRQGLQLTVRIDTSTAPAAPKTQVEESDTTNNTTAISAQWKLPDLIVSNIERPTLAFDSVLETLTYTVRNNGQAPVGGAWSEQLWLGTDASITTANDPMNGVWHVQVPIGSSNPSSEPKTYTAGSEGPMAPETEAIRMLVPNLTGIQIPEGVEASQLNWILLLDWPANADAAGADPGAVLETHDVPAPQNHNNPPNAFLYPAAEIDLSPLRLAAVNGSFNFNGSLNQFEASGMIQVGFEPADGDEFTPLLTVEGSAKFNKLVIELNGKVTVNVFDLQVPLFDGTFKFDVGQAASNFLQETIGNIPTQYTVAGIEIALTRLAFVNPGGGSIADARIELEGKLKFPESLGGVELTVTDPNKIAIDTSGVSITGAGLNFPDVEFNLLNLLKVKATGLSITYTSSPEATLKLQGQIELPDIYDATADFAGDNYIQIRETGIDVVGTLSVGDIVIVKDAWEIKSASLTIDTTQDRVEGTATLLIPTGIEIMAGLGFLNGDLNFISLGVADLNKPIGATGAFLQDVNGKVNNLAPAAQDPLTFSGGVRVTGGPMLTVNVPSWAGGPYSGAAVELDVNGSIDANHLTANGTLNLIGGLVTGTGNAELNWNQGFLKANGSLTALGGLITFTGNFQANSNLDITMSASASVTLPNAIPILGGKTLGSASSYFQYRNNGSSTDDFVAGWGSITLPIIGTKTGGVRVRFDGSWDFIGSKTIASLSAQQQQVYLSLIGYGSPSPQTTTSAMETFSVDSGTPWVLFGADWDNAVSNVPVQLMKPDGTLLNESDIASDPDIEIVDDLTDMTGVSIIVNNPASGNWTIILPVTTGLGTPSFNALTAPSGAPQITLTGPATDQSLSAGSSLQIDYKAFDPDDDAIVALYIDTDREGFDGQLIASGIMEMDGAANHSWDTTGIRAGDYFIYAVIQDADNIPVMSGYSLGRVRITDPLAPGPVTAVETAFIGDGRIRVNWNASTNADYYRVSYTSNAAGIPLPQSAVTDGAETSIVLAGLNPGETYRFAVQAVANPDHVSPPVFATGIAGARATVMPGTGEWNVFADPGQTFSASIDLEAGDTPSLIDSPNDATLDPQTGTFEWSVPNEQSGFTEIVIDVTHSDGSVTQIRRLLESNPLRLTQISGQVFDDPNGNGGFDAAEAGISGVSLELIDAGNGSVLDTIASSDRDGNFDGLFDSHAEQGWFDFIDLTPGDYIIRQILPAGMSPTTSAQLPLTLVGGTVSEILFGRRNARGSLAGTVFADDDGNGMQGTGETGVAGTELFLDLNQNGLPDVAEINFETRGTLGIPDNGSLLVPLSVDLAGGTVDSLSVSLELTHEFAGDLAVTLISPAGTEVHVFSNLSLAAAETINTILSDSAAQAIQTAAAPLNGPFQPSFPLAIFHGEPADGTWLLRVSDDSPGATGSLDRFGLQLAVTEPRTASLTDDAGTAGINEAGSYSFSNVPGAAYRVARVPAAGSTVTTPSTQAGQSHSVNLVGDSTLAGLDFGQQSVSDSTPPSVLATQLNNGSAQRSRFTEVAIEFDDNVSPGLDLSDFTLANLTLGQVIPSTQLALSFDVTSNRITLAPKDSGPSSLADGDYELTVNAAGFTDLGGNSLVQDYSVNFHVFAGDTDGDRVANDFDLYNLWQNLLKSAEQRDTSADLNADGNVDALDLDIVKGNYLSRLSPIAPQSGAPLPYVIAATRPSVPSYWTMFPDEPAEDEDDDLLAPQSLDSVLELSFSENLSNPDESTFLHLY